MKRARSVTVEWDEDARREYLTGFRARKDQRRREAMEQASLRAKQQLKEERNEVRKLDGRAAGSPAAP